MFTKVAPKLVIFYISLMQKVGQVKSTDNECTQTDKLYNLFWLLTGQRIGNYKEYFWAIYNLLLS